MPSDNMPTRTHGEKSLAIAAFSQEMTLASLLRCQQSRYQTHPQLLESVRSSLLNIYTAAGFENPAAVVALAQKSLSERLNSVENSLTTSGQ
jgi:division protein CdvB (Snf7/Vps24/ESCRT-III family)